MEKFELDLREQENCNKTRSYSKWIRLNQEFHYRIYRCAERPVLLETIVMLSNRTLHYVRTYTALQNRTVVATSEHKKIFDAILRKDRVAASEWTSKHLTSPANRLIQYLKDKRQLS